MTAQVELNVNENPAAKEADANANKENLRSLCLRNFNELVPGDVFKAQITDIQPGKVSIRLDTGDGLTARSYVLPEARIGDMALFAVKENRKGQINLEMLKPQTDSLKENIVRNALISAEVYPSGENIKLAKTLMDNNLPIDAQTLQKAVFFHYSAAALPLDKIMFLLKENFPMNTVNIELLDKIMEPLGITGGLNNIFEGFGALPPDTLRQVINNFMPLIADFAPAYADLIKKNPQSLKKVIEGIKLNLPITLNDKTSLDRLPDYFKRLYKALSQTEELLTGSSKTALRADIALLREQLLFIDHIGNFKDYIQIPLTVNDNANNAELFVFKNPKKANINKTRISALIAIDYDTIGRVETFLEVLGKSLKLQFRAANSDTLTLINNNFDALKDSLSKSGINISSVTYKNIKEAFTVLNDIDLDEDNHSERRRYSFDMRV